MSKCFKICDKMNLFAPIFSFCKVIRLSQLLTSEILLFDLIFFYQKFLLFFFIFSNGFRQKFLITALSTGADPPKKKSERGGRTNFGDSSTSWLHNTARKARFITMVFIINPKKRRGRPLGPPPKSDLCTSNSLLKNWLFYTLTRSGCYIFLFFLLFIS